jgi:hypothetical protein
VELRLRQEEIQRPSSGPVSLTQLKHPPARKAFGALVAEQRFSEAGQYAKAVGELEKPSGFRRSTPKHSVLSSGKPARRWAVVVDNAGPSPGKGRRIDDGHQSSA